MRLPVLLFALTAFRPQHDLVRVRQSAAARGAGHGLTAGRVACPHCTNVDTLRLHCDNDRCGWAWCSCGALIYDRRRHRHPRHRTGRDTCHDPRAAV